LLEVLVALFVLAIGLLGVAGMQMNALKTAHSSAQKSEATMLAYLMLDAMRANRTAALNGSYNLAEWTCTPPSGGTLPQNDQHNWLQKAQAMLGTATCGAIACDGAGNCTVKLRWDDSRAGGSDQSTFSLTSRL
jgi:type IV pilus assembly protein PilV